VSEPKQLEVAWAAETLSSTVTLRAEGGRCHLDLRLEDGRTLSADDRDYFECLLAIRRVLEQDGAFVLCQGARRDVWPSGMSRSTGAGLIAYVLTPGRGPTDDERVETFDRAERAQVTTVAEQERTFEEWIQSRGFDPPHR
jgi:hypothetical protein